MAAKAEILYAIILFHLQTLAIEHKHSVHYEKNKEGILKKHTA